MYEIVQKSFMCYIWFLFQINGVLLNFLFVKESWKRVQFPQVLSSTTVFNIYNDMKCLLSTKSGDHVSLKTGVMADNIQLCHHRNKGRF